MICPTCGTENPAGAKFCNECATRFAAVCVSCGTVNAAGAKFCSECASPLAATAAPADLAAQPGAPGAGPAPVAERRLVSILFADLVGFTPFAEGRDAEEVRETLGRYFELARGVIGRYGGTVEKFIGDAVMAVWGAPAAHEDDAERAVRAALDLVDAVNTLGPTIQARAGVLTGEAAVTLSATGQGMVAGDLVNTASRLQSVAPPGSVLVGEATHRAASRAITFEEAGEQTLKGKSSPVPAWRALRVVAQVGGRNRADTLEAPFVGRDSELRLLKDLFHATSRDRRGRLVSVIGPAGIGKSRLAWEFLKYLDGLVEQVWYHDGRSPAYGDGITFWALGEMVRRRAGLLETDDEATTRARISAMVAEHVPDPEERGWIEPALLALLGIASGAPSDQLLAAWRTFFERLAASAPVVLVFEDFHFADSGLLDFVDHVLEWSRNVPIYVLTLARPELLERRPDWGAGKRNFTSLYLEPLSGEAIRELLAGLVPGLPDPAVRAVVERAGGVPLYAVETVRMLLADRLLTLEGDVYVPSGDLTSLAVPESLTALIASRLDGLPPDERALVQDAAVLGQSFTPAALAAVTGLDEETLEPRLRSLVRRELLVQATDPRSPERGQYAFVQALIREVAYGTLARRTRKVKHLAAARFFDSLDSGELAGALAGHYLAAYRHAHEGAEAEALAAQARVALRGAAERAVSLGAHDQAVTLFEQALTVATTPDERADLLERAGESGTAAGHYVAAEGSLWKALDLRSAGGDRAAIAGTTAQLGRTLLHGRHTEQAIAVLEPAAAAVADLAADPAVVALNAQLARAYFLHSEPKRALEVVEAVLEAAEHADLVAVLADALVTRGSALTDIGRHREGIGVIATGEQLARANGLTDTYLRALNNRTVNQTDFDPRAFLDGAREGLALARRIGDRKWMLQFTSGLGLGSFAVGDWEAAMAAWQVGLAENPEPGDRLLFVYSVLLVRACRGEAVRDELAELAGLAGDITDEQILWAAIDGPAWAAFAEGRLSEAGRIWRENARRSSLHAASMLPLSARVALLEGDAASASSDLAALTATGFHTPRAELQRAAIQAGLAALDGRTADAIRLYEQALRGFRELPAPFEHALTAIDMAALLDPSLPEVRQAAEQARAFLAGVGARPFVARLEAALARQPEASQQRAPMRRAAQARITAGP